MSELSIGETARLLATSTDTVRRLVAAGTLRATRSAGGHRRVEAASLADYLEGAEAQRPARGDSVRNRLLGVVIRVVRDRVTAQVDIRCGPHRLVSVITREAADELGLERGTVVVASVKATNVTVQLPSR